MTLVMAARVGKVAFPARRPARGLGNLRRETNLRPSPPAWKNRVNAQGSESIREKIPVEREPGRAAGASEQPCSYFFFFKTEDDV